MITSSRLCFSLKQVVPFLDVVNVTALSVLRKFFINENAMYKIQ